MDAKPVCKLVAHLMSIKQGANKSLSDYARKFNEEVLVVEDYTEQSVIHPMLSGLRPRRVQMRDG